MAVTGLMLVCFITVHLLGNLSVFAGADGINAYAKHLHDLGPLVWVFRLVMLGLFAVHITFGIQLYLENKAATPEQYAVQKTLVTTFFCKNHGLYRSDYSGVPDLSPASFHRTGHKP